jgi:hypothetical protein
VQRSMTMCFSALASDYAKLIPYFPSGVTIFMEILQEDMEQMLAGLPRAVCVIIGRLG